MEKMEHCALSKQIIRRGPRKEQQLWKTWFAATSATSHTRTLRLCVALEILLAFAASRSVLGRPLPAEEPTDSWAPEEKRKRKRAAQQTFGRVQANYQEHTQTLNMFHFFDVMVYLLHTRRRLVPSLPFLIHHNVTYVFATFAPQEMRSFQTQIDWMKNKIGTPTRRKRKLNPHHELRHLQGKKMILKTRPVSSTGSDCIRNYTCWANFHSFQPINRNWC